MNILCISMCLPYDGVQHAGGKTVNYYYKKLSHEKDIDITVISKVKKDELDKLNILPNSFKLYPVMPPDGFFQKIIGYAVSLNSKINPFYKYGNTLLAYTINGYFKVLAELKNDGYIPDIIILEWTQMVLLINAIKKLYPDSKIISSEHDITFQAYQRKYTSESIFLKKIYRYLKYINMTALELGALRQSDMIVVQSHKDAAILKNNQIPSNKIHIISPFFIRCEQKWKGCGKLNIVIYGDMSRIENYGSAIWFIQNVFNYINIPDMKLYILGGHPNKGLFKYSDEKIIITGFVDNIFDIFNDCFCMVAPLQLGAGIKVKCLEALSFGIPLLANSIAMEGIDAENGKSYIHCESPKDFINSINKLYKNQNLQQSISDNAIIFSSQKLNLNKAYIDYKKTIYDLYSIKKNI